MSEVEQALLYTSSTNEHMPLYQDRFFNSVPTSICFYSKMMHDFGEVSITNFNVFDMTRSRTEPELKAKTLNINHGFIITIIVIHF